MAEVHIQMCVWSSKYRRLINLKTYEGLRSPVEAYGFDSKGIPVLGLDPNDAAIKYKIVSQTPTTRVDLSATSTIGVRSDMKRDASGKLIVTPKVKGVPSMEIMLGRNGCAPPKDLEKKIDALIRNGMSRIYVYKESNVRGMAQAYGFNDYWNVSAEAPEADYDGFNSFLASLKSPWRIITEEQIDTLQKNTLDKLWKGV
jgi:hypothetical protein